MIKGKKKVEGWGRDGVNAPLLIFFYQRTVFWLMSRKGENAKLRLERSKSGVCI